MFQNVNNRKTLARAFKPDDAPQAYCQCLDDFHAVKLQEVPIGTEFFLDHYPDYAGCFFQYEVDHDVDEKITCTWISTTGKLITNRDENTLCYSIFNGATTVYVTTTELGDILHFKPIEEVDKAIEAFQAEEFDIKNSIENIQYQLRLIMDHVGTGDAGGSRSQSP